jgi:hypothetical protein
MVGAIGEAAQAGRQANRGGWSVWPALGAARVPTRHTHCGHCPGALPLFALLSRAESLLARALPLRPARNLVVTLAAVLVCTRETLLANMLVLCIARHSALLMFVIVLIALCPALTSRSVS